MIMDDFTSEYTTVFRVSHSTIPPTDYNFLPQNEHPTTAQYAREMTLASGRTVYEVWDFWANTLLGYHIPIQILLEARKHRNGLSDWEKLPKEKRHEHFQTRFLVMDLVPRIPVLSSKIITERLVRHAYRSKISKLDIEKEVVEHARHCYTSYSLLLQQREREQNSAWWQEDAVDRTVQPRMRAVLGEWMGSGVGEGPKARFFERHGLAVWRGGTSRDAQISAEIDDGTVANMTWCGGEETIGNFGVGSQQHGIKHGGVTIFS